MKQVYLFNEGSRAAIYGIGTYIRQMVAFLSGRQDIRLNLVMLNSDKNEFEVEEKDGYRTFYFPRVSLPQDKLEIYIRNTWYVLYPYIEEDLVEEDRLFFHFNYGQELPLLELAKQYFPKCTTLFTIHYQKWCFELSGNTTCFKKIMQDCRDGKSEGRFKEITDDKEKERAVYSAADAVICLSRYTYGLLLEEYGIDVAKIHLVYNGLSDEYPVYEEKEPALIKRDLHFDESGKLILFVGRLDDIKGVDCLVEAFKIVSDAYPDSQLLMVGEGNYASCLEKAKGIWNRITFTGRLSKDELYRLYRIADVGVMPSKHEQCSYVAMEMMMFGVPLVSSTSTGLAEMGNGLYKLHIEETDEEVRLSADDLARLIMDALRNPETGRLFRNEYEQKFTLERMKEKMERIYGLI